MRRSLGRTIVEQLPPHGRALLAERVPRVRSSASRTHAAPDAAAPTWQPVRETADAASNPARAQQAEDVERSHHRSNRHHWRGWRHWFRYQQDGLRRRRPRRKPRLARRGLSTIACPLQALAELRVAVLPLAKRGYQVLGVHEHDERLLAGHSRVVRL